MATSKYAVSRLAARTVSQINFEGVRAKFLAWIEGRTDQATGADALLGAMNYSKDPDRVLSEAKRIYDQALADDEDSSTGQTGIDPLVQPPILARIDIVTAAGAAIVSKETYLDCTVTISGVPGVADYFGTAQIRGRGNSTWGYTKKPYKLKLKAAAPLMGMPAFDDWALLANAHESDPSMINNALGLTLASRAKGLDWTPRSQFAVLYLNGVAQGLYQLTESVKIGADRVNVTKASGSAGLSVTGAYLLEIDRRGYGAGEPGFQTSHGVQIIYDDPSGSNTTQAAAIATAVQAFETALYSSTWLDPTTGYARFIDMDSFIDWYIVNELASSQDSNFYSSCKLYKVRDTATAVGKIFMGPVWDLNLAFGVGIGSQVSVHTPTGYYTRNYADDVNPGGGAIWIDRMFGDPAFRTALSARWLAFVASLSDLNALIDTLAVRTAGPGLADQALWSYSSSWAADAAAKKSWLATRIGWLTDQFVIQTVVPGKVTNLAATPTSSSTALLAWSAISGSGVDDYLVQYRVAGTTPWTTFNDGTSLTASATITSLTPSTAYEFRVAAVNEVGAGTYSDVATASTPAAGPVSIISDPFTRADSLTTLGSAPTGQAWSALDGVFGISGNKAAYVSGGSGNTVAVVDSGAADVKLTCTMVHTDSGSNWQRVLFRVVDVNNMWALQLQNGGLKLYKVAGGSFGEVANAAAEASATTVFEITAVGSSISIKQDGVQKIAITDVTYATATKCGFGGAQNTAFRWDDFVVAAP